MDGKKLNKLLYKADNLFLEVNDKNFTFKSIRKFNGTLKEIYDIFEPLLFKNAKKEYKNYFNKSDDLLVHWVTHQEYHNKIPITLINHENKIYENILKLKQKLGYGIKRVKK